VRACGAVCVLIIASARRDLAVSLCAQTGASDEETLRAVRQEEQAHEVSHCIM
jgi:hypothetical protein